MTPNACPGESIHKCRYHLRGGFGEGDGGVGLKMTLAFYMIMISGNSFKLFRQSNFKKFALL